MECPLTKMKLKAKNATKHYGTRKKRKTTLAATGSNSVAMDKS